MAVETLPMTRRERKKQQVEKDIRRAALRLFQDKGFKETNVDEILELADISKGTFYNYFPSKEAVLMRIAQRSVEQITTALQKSPYKNDPIRMLEEAYNYLIDDVYSWRNVARYVATMHAQQGTGAHRAVCELFEAYVLQAQEAGIVSKEFESACITQVLAGSYYAAIIGLDDHVQIDECKQFLKNALALHMRGMCADGAAD
ncbi:TetR/AcrR family transcriptional regulator [Christensenellaceae bacterium OttesenSCG-928-L17]|nr:TetR/AcrR family transcriptional regulator [Christensenellaceae bacterium OttesenSCG-928-L17]